MGALIIKSDISELGKIRKYLKNGLKRIDISDEEYYMIELSLLEICINIIRYAYPHQSQGEIILKSWLEDKKIFLEIRDDGIHFDPRKSEKPNIDEIIKQKKKGGLGIFISRKFMDGFNYKRENNQNILVIYKEIGGL
ncbi:ATP-binding protein [Acidobacteriota bacterium]